MAFSFLLKRLSAFHFIRIHVRNPSKKQEKKRRNYLHSPWLSKTDRLKYLLKCKLVISAARTFEKCLQSSRAISSPPHAETGAISSFLLFKIPPLANNLKQPGKFKPQLCTKQLTAHIHGLVSFATVQSGLHRTLQQIS